MRVSQFLKEEGIKKNRIHIAFAKWDRDNDDFHIIPSPVFTFVKGELLNLFGIGIKLGFWGLGIGISFPRTDIDVTRKTE